LCSLLEIVAAVLRDLILVALRSGTELIAENLFLRRQLALYFERKVRRLRPQPATKLALVFLSRLFSWRDAHAIVKARYSCPLAPG
jgi:putative transposase